VALLLGAGLRTWGFVRYAKTRRFIDRAATARGRIVGTARYETRGGNDARDTILAVVRFPLPDGRGRRG